MSFRNLLAILFTLSLTSPAIADPSLWHIKSGNSEVYLLGSVHVLPPDLKWRTAEISGALSRSDVYVFEVPQDETAVTELNALIQAQGFLPPGTSLRSLSASRFRPAIPAIRVPAVRSMEASCRTNRPPSISNLSPSDGYPSWQSRSLKPTMAGHRRIPIM